MGTLYIDTGGSATNSGSTDQNSANISGTAATVSGSVVTLDGSPNLSGLVTSGATQSSIYLNQATNTNAKIFWITAFDDTANTVTVSVAPTGVTSSAWAIGGRHVFTPASLWNVLRAGDTVIFNNSPAAQAAIFFTLGNSGNSTSGWITVKGKTGVRPVLNVTNTSNVIASGGSYVRYENLELDQDGASGNCFNNVTLNFAYNVKMSDCGASMFSTVQTGNKVVCCELSGGGASGLSAGFQNITAFGNYIHDLTSVGINLTSDSSAYFIAFNIIDTCGAQGIYFNAAFTSVTGLETMVLSNTIYGCGNSGIEVSDQDFRIGMFNNILKNNGDAAGEYNVEFVASAAELNSFHIHNCFHSSGAGGSANLSNLTPDATDITSDPLLTDPANGDFTLQPGSPCKGTGHPGQFLGGSTGYMDMGAVQRRDMTPRPSYQMGI